MLPPLFPVLSHEPLVVVGLPGSASDHKNTMEGVPCGVVVVEERDARGSSVRRSRRIGTVVYARAHGGGTATLELVGDAGSEEHAFRKDKCQIFRSFLGEGKLTVCTAGMRHQVRGVGRCTLSGETDRIGSDQSDSISFVSKKKRT